MKAPDINDTEFPGLPGMSKPKVEDDPAGEDDAEKASGDEEEDADKVWVEE